MRICHVEREGSRTADVLLSVRRHTSQTGTERHRGTQEAPAEIWAATETAAPELKGDGGRKVVAVCRWYAAVGTADGSRRRGQMARGWQSSGRGAVMDGGDGQE